jgi:NAD(P)-dependent dehydrogenase (short-subunit alcohol dehydrogenase family)
MTGTSIGDGGGVLVTGGAGGIGSAIVSRLQADGVPVAVIDRVRPAGCDVFAAADVTNEAAMQTAVAEVIDALGSIDGLVCAAGVVSERPLRDLDGEEWRRVVDVSLTGTYHAVRLVAPTMAARGSGSIVALSSGYARAGYRFGGHYAAAKAGIEAFIRSVALELGPEGVRANVIAPGPVMTPMIGHIPDRDKWQRDREARIPLRRIAQPEDIVGPVMFLLGPASAYVTGQVLQVNGGLIL